ncbi:hypothetical protein YB2330_002183 [Saitoella coloradoensis]
MDLPTLALHADDHLALTRDLAPPLHPSTTFRYPSDPADLIPASEQSIYENSTDDKGKPKYIYSRLTAPTLTRTEAVLSGIMDAPTVLYSSGLAAAHAVLTFLKPKRILIGEGGYHGVHALIEQLARLSPGSFQKDGIDADIGPDDIVWVENPLNPYGTINDLALLSQKAHSIGAKICVDMTFAPPPMSSTSHIWDELELDFVMHSCTKYFGGHSDLLSGSVSTRDEEAHKALLTERTFWGSTPGSMEQWLLLRSLRTLDMRVRQQSTTATILAQKLFELAASSTSPIQSVHHASLQPASLTASLFPSGLYPACFAIVLRTGDLAKRFPSKLKVFNHCTSLGGVESCVEWRAMSDATCDPGLVRISVGVEASEDLVRDFVQGLEALDKEVTT